MKTILLILSLIIATNSNAQIKTFSSIVIDSSMKKEQLFKNALIWFAKATNSFNNQITNKISFGLKDNIIINNREDGELTGTLRGIAHQFIGDNLYSFDISIKAKDYKYKYDLTNFRYLGNSLANAIAGQNMAQDIPFDSLNFQQKKVSNVIKKVNEDVNNIIMDLIKSMAIHQSKDF